MPERKVYSKKPVGGAHGDLLDKGFGDKNSFWVYSPGKFIMPEQFSNFAQQILDCEVREDDVWLMGYPRSGTHWIQEMTWLIGNECNFEKARNTLMQLRAPMIEQSTYFMQYEKYMNESMKELLNSVEYVEKLESPRFIKAHLPVEFLPNNFEKVNPKTIYIARNPKDVFTSYYHHLQLLHHMKDISLEEFFELFISGDVPIGDILDHNLGFWNKRNTSRTMFIKFEDAKFDTPGTIRKIADFLNKTISEKQIDELIDYLSFENMQNNPSVNLEQMIKSEQVNPAQDDQKFIRKGIVGDWKNLLSEDLSLKFDEWVKEKLEGTGLYFE